MHCSVARNCCVPSFSRASARKPEIAGTLPQRTPPYGKTDTDASSDQENTSNGQSSDFELSDLEQHPVHALRHDDAAVPAAGTGLSMTFKVLLLHGR